MPVNAERLVPGGLAALSERERTSILLAYYQAQTYREVAASLSVGAGTVTHRMRSGLRRLGEYQTRHQ